MIKRRIHDQLVAAIENNPAVALLGPRQSGKTTLALEIGKTRPSLYLDLGSLAFDRLGGKAGLATT
jgi:predicted AAA+ superfamily ATPase